MKSFKYGGKDGRQFNLVEANDMVVVRTTEDADLRSLDLSPTSRSLAEGMLPVLAFPEANVIVYKVVGQTDENNILETRNAIRKSLNEEEQVEFAGRTLVDAKTGEIVVYTENIFVKFKDEVSEKTCGDIFGKLGLTIKQQYKFAKNAYFLQSPEGTGMKVFDIAEALLKMPEVEACHPELVTERQVKFIHPMQWHLHKTSIGGQVVDQHIQVEDAWEITRGSGITIAVIDNGVEVTHEAFSTTGKIAGQRNTLYGVNDARPLSPFAKGGNHGTSCAGVACADAPNGTKGVAPEAKLMALVCGSLGSLSEAVAFEWAAENGADIISCSWGPVDGPWFLPSHPSHNSVYMLPDSTRYAIDYAATQGRGGKGCVIVWAAGNGNESVDLDGYAGSDKVIAVAACNDRGRRSIYSDYGNAIWCCFPSNDFYWPQLQQPKPLTPGIWTADISGGAGSNRGGVMKSNADEDDSGNYTSSFGGTSSACPGAAGVAALILSVNPNLTREHVKDIMKNACDKIDASFGNYNALGHSPFYGYGKLNAAKAVQLAQATLPARLSLQIDGIARFRVQKPLLIGSDNWAETTLDNDRLLDIELRLSPSNPEIGIGYKIITSTKGTAIEGLNGQPVALGDKRKKITGFAAWLTGPLAAGFEMSYEVRFTGIKEPKIAKDGAVCGSVSGKGAGVDGLKLSIIKKEP